MLSCLTRSWFYKKFLGNITQKKVLIVCEEWPPSHLKEWDSLAKHLSKLQFLITCDSCTCTISCTTGEIWLFFLTFPLLLGAELQLVIVRTWRPFPSLHKGHPLTNDPFCKPNALHLGNWRGRHYPLHPWPCDKNSSHFTEKKHCKVYWEDNPKMFFLLSY